MSPIGFLSSGHEVWITEDKKMVPKSWFVERTKSSLQAVASMSVAYIQPATASKAISKILFAVSTAKRLGATKVMNKPTWTTVKVLNDAKNSIVWNKLCF